MKKIIKNFISAFGYTISKKHTFPSLDLYILLNRYIKKNNALEILDIGANEGQTAIKFADYFPASTIHSFEPVGSTFEILRSKTAHLKKIKTYRLGLGDTEESREIYFQNFSYQNSVLNEFRNNHGSEIIDLTTVDKFMESQNIRHIDILKSDTEGFELNVINGAKRVLTHQLVDFLYIEVGFNETDSRHVYFINLVNVLRAYDYKFIGLFEPEYYGLELGYANALFISKNHLAAYNGRTTLSN